MKEFDSINNNIDKTRSTFQRKINTMKKHTTRFITGLSNSLKKERIYHQRSEDFITMLLNDGRTTKEELSKYFTKIKLDK